MDAFDDYSFDVRGFVHIRNALSAGELRRARRTVDSGDVGRLVGWLPGTAAAAARAAALCGDDRHAGRGAAAEARLGSPPVVVGSTADRSLSGGGVRRERSAGYFHREGSRVVQALRAVWALEDHASDILLVPGSHRAALEAPPSVLSGEDDLRSLSAGIYQTPELAAGDLLLFSPALLSRCSATIPNALVSCEYLAEFASQVGERAAEGEFEGELSAELRSILLFEQGAEAATLGGVPTVLSDGSSTRLGDAATARADHPAALVPPEVPTIDPAEAFAWDLNGYLILRGLMPPDLLTAAHAALDAQYDQVATARDRSRALADTATAEHQGAHRVGNKASDELWADGSAHSAEISGYPRMDVSNLLSLPLPHCLPFREMAAHPAIVQRLQWIQGPGFKLNTLGFTIVSENGCGGQSLHANGTPLWGAVNAFDLHDGRFHAGSVNVAWQLHDVDQKSDGGFVIIPGSHKACYGCPTEDPGHPRAPQDLGLVQPRVHAGDVVIFMGSATTHGAWAVTGDKPRRASLYSYLSRHDALINRAAL